MNKVYVVTGVTSGIGKALLEKLAVNNVVFAGFRDQEKGKELEKVSDKIYPFYVDCYWWYCINYGISIVSAIVPIIHELKEFYTKKVRHNG